MSAYGVQGKTLDKELAWVKTMELYVLLSRIRKSSDLFLAETLDKHDAEHYVLDKDLKDELDRLAALPGPKVL